MENYGSADVQKILGISQKLFNQWLDRKHIFASMPARGSGYRNRFTLVDLYRIRLFQKLIDHGFTLPGASGIAFSPVENELIGSLLNAGESEQKYRQEKHMTLLASARTEPVLWVFFKGEKITEAQLVTSNDRIGDVIYSADMAMIVNFSAVVKEVHDLISLTENR